MFKASEVPWLGKRVAVVGDVILDKYVRGYVERVSPEAPVPILNVTDEEYKLGGAANVALNVKRLGGFPLLVGRVGSDAGGAKFEQVLFEHEVDGKGVLISDSVCTSVKTRFVTDDGVQLLRCDEEVIKDLGDGDEQIVNDVVKRMDIDAIILADYDKGFITESLATMLLGAAVMKGIPSLVDPKRKHWGSYRQAAMVTPNKKEAASALGLNPRDHEGDYLAWHLLERFSLNSVLVTQGSKGMVLVQENGMSVVRVPTHAQEVFDVSGAGDTVAAMMALAMSVELDMAGACLCASKAAGVSVNRHGTYAPRLEEVFDG